MAAAATASGLGSRLPARKAVITDINPVLIGWFGYYKHAHKNTFVRMDGWVQMRLRSILRNRHRRKGRGRGLDHQRYPNEYFADQPKVQPWVLEPNKKRSEGTPHRFGWDLRSSFAF